MKWYKYNIKDLSDSEYNKWYLLMSNEKRQRVNRLRFGDDKKRTVAGEMIARKAVFEWCGIQPDKIIFDTGVHGKPYAVGLDVEFNISHSGNMVVCAVNDKPVGIDIEQIRPIDLTIAKRICTNDELIYLFGHEAAETDFTYTDNVDILSRFFEIWTAKEAYGKCIGAGLISDALFSDDYEHTHILCDDKFDISIVTVK